MKYSLKDIHLEINALLQKYPSLGQIENTPKEIKITGQISINRVVEDFHVVNDYMIQIVIPYSSDKLPIVFDIDEKLDRNYPHLYKNRALCLETDIVIYTYFKNSFNLVEWYEQFVEPYFVSYEYYMLYNCFIFGDRPHDVVGLISSYMDIFELQSIYPLILILHFILSSKYRGHLLCPCNSGKKIRECHGVKMIEFYESKKMYCQLKEDFRQIYEFISKK